MKLTILKTVCQEVELSVDDMRDVTHQYLLRLVYPGEYLREISGKVVVMQDDPQWRHGSVGEEYVRDATPTDIAAFTLLKILKASK